MTTITIKIEESEKEALQKYAEENDLTMSQIIRKLIKNFIKNEAKEDSGLE